MLFEILALGLTLLAILPVYLIYRLIKPHYDVRQFEKRNNSKFLIVTDTFWENTTFSPIKLFYKRYILDIDDDDEFQKWFAGVVDHKIKRIDIVVHTYGGSLVSSDLIIKNLLDYDGTINIYVPYHAMSAGTRLMVMGDKIFMNAYALASPMDPQVTLTESGSLIYTSVRSLLKLVQRKGIKKVKDSIGLQFIEYEKLFEDNIRILNMVLKKKYNDKVVKTIIEKLGHGDISHHIPHNPTELREIGLPIKNNVPKPVMNLYDQIVDLG